MSKLDELIQKYCPNGVEKVELGKVCKIVRGNSLSKADIGLGDTPIILYGELYTTYGHRIQKVVSMTSMDIARKATLIQKGDILLPLSSTTKEAQIGKASVYNAENDAYLGGDAMILRNSQNSYYLAYYINSTLFEKEKMRCVQGTTIMHLHPSKLMKISIPLPPLPVQEEIVRMLDAMTDLQENLEKELEERRKQYAFYRDKLLSFNELTTPPSWRIEWKRLGEIGKFYGGLSGKTKEDFTNGNAKFITYMNVFTHPILQIDVEDKVFISDGEKQHTIKYGDVLFTGSSETPEECGMTSVMTTKTEEDIYLNSFCFGYRFTSLDDICPSFMAHLFRSTNIRKQIVKTANGVTRFNVSKILCEKISIPLPPLSVQQEIVEKLDKMEELVSNIESELVERKRQYEHYREQLFLFAK